MKSGHGDAPIIVISLSKAGYTNDNKKVKFSTPLVFSIN